MRTYLFRLIYFPRGDVRCVFKGPCDPTFTVRARDESEAEGKARRYAASLAALIHDLELIEVLP